MTEIIKDPGERSLVLHSRLTGPIRRLGFLERSLLFAELSMISYNDLAEARAAAKKIGFTDCELFDNDGSQAYRFRSAHDCVVACRGTEPGEWNDVRADINAAAALAETIGRVHRGFKQEVDDLWPLLETALTSNVLPVWFCGHSLGGAMATICAGRCFLSHISSIPEELYTYGSPRVGDRRYINYVRLTYYRWVNNNDIVTRVPPAWMGYRHAGQEVYLDHRGMIRPLSGWTRVRDRLRGWATGLLRMRVDPLSDHSIHSYVAAIHAAVEAHQSSQERTATERQGAPQLIHS